MAPDTVAWVVQPVPWCDGHGNIAATVPSYMGFVAVGGGEERVGGALQ